MDFMIESNIIVLTAVPVVVGAGREAFWYRERDSISVMDHITAASALNYPL